jgi:hypothetical protein
MLSMIFMLAILSGQVGDCLLTETAGNQVTSSNCLQCHADHEGRGCHPQGIMYREKSGYRSLSFVQSKLYLEEGKIVCLTCHSAKSTVKYKLFIPDNKFSTAVRPGRPETYQSVKLVNPPPGTAVTPTPLCVTCHSFD